MRKIVPNILLLIALVIFPAVISANEPTYTSWPSGTEQITDTQKVWTVEFNEEINEQSVEGNIKLVNSSNSIIPVTTSVSEDLKSIQVYLSAGQQYEINNEYRLYIGPGITSLDNQPLSQNIVFNFVVLEEMTVTSTIDSIDHDFLHLSNGKSIRVGEFSTLFIEENTPALENAEVSVLVKNNTITSIESLNILASGNASSNLTLDGNGTIIDGSLNINGDYLTLKNLVIQKDFTVRENTRNVLELDNITANGVTSIQQNGIAQMASLTRVANASVTKLTLKFNNSKFINLEIYKQDTEITATGSTSFTYVQFASNTSFYADPDIILPKIKIIDGVAKVELNATVLEMDIETTENLEINGSGNFENINVHSAGKVNLNLTGNIEKLEIQNEHAKVSINEKAFVGDVIVPEGANVDDIIDQGDEQVGPLPEPDKYYAVGLLKAEPRSSKATLNLKNVGPYTVKYVQTRERKDLPTVGEKAPSEAVVYGGEVIDLWRAHYVVVFLVDSNNRIIKRDDLETEVNIKIDFEGNQMVINLFAKDPSENVADTMDYFAYYRNREFLILEEDDLSKLSWNQEGMYHVLYIPISANLALTTGRELYFRSDISIPGHVASRKGGEEFHMQLLEDAYQLYVSDDKHSKLLTDILRDVLSSISIENDLTYDYSKTNEYFRIYLSNPTYYNSYAALLEILN